MNITKTINLVEKLLTQLKELEQNLKPSETKPTKPTKQPILSVTVTEKQPKGMIKRQVVQEILGIANNTLYNYVNRGILPKPTKIGVRSYWNRKDIQLAKKVLSKQK